MNEKYASIKIERDIWEAEKEEIRKLVKIDSEIVSLNVGGTHHIQTEKEVIPWKKKTPISTSDLNQFVAIKFVTKLERGPIGNMGGQTNHRLTVPRQQPLI